MNQSSFLAVLHELFEADAGTIQSTSVLQDVPGWSSLTFIGLNVVSDNDFHQPQSFIAFAIAKEQQLTKIHRD